MKFTVVAALLGAAATVSATSELPKSLPELFSQIPTCADKCISDAMPGLCPSVESYWCRCHNSVKGRLMSKTFDCAIEACGSMEAALEYQKAAENVCDNIKEVTLHAQKHVELRQVASGSGSGSVGPTGSVSRSVSGSATGSRTLSRTQTNTVTSTTTNTSLPPANNGAAGIASTSGSILFASVAGLAVVSFMGMLI